MRLTTKSEYALLALTYLARNADAGYVTVQVIAKAQQIPAQFLEQLLLILKRGKYLQSLRGKHGGYRLAKPADAITLAEVIRLFDGALAPTDSVSQYYYAPSPIEREQPLLQLFREIRDHVATRLEQTTLADVSR